MEIGFFARLPLLTTADNCGQLQTTSDNYGQLRTTADSNRQLRFSTTRAGEVRNDSGLLPSLRFWAVNERLCRFLLKTPGIPLDFIDGIC